MLDEAKRKAMAAAGRAHVEKLGWMAAVKRIRDTQYQRAINTFRAHKRCSFSPARHPEPAVQITMLLHLPPPTPLWAHRRILANMAACAFSGLVELLRRPSYRRCTLVVHSQPQAERSMVGK